MKTYVQTILIALLLGMFLTACDPGTPPELQPTAEQKIARGKYLVDAIACHDCHTPKVFTPEGPKFDMERQLSGHPSDIALEPFDTATAKNYALFNGHLTGFVGPWGASFAANLTPDESGIGNWTEEQFFRALREGKSKGLESSRMLLPPMPWEVYGKLNDEDISAIFAYLKTIKPIRNVVPGAMNPEQLAEYMKEREEQRHLSQSLPAADK